MSFARAGAAKRARCDIVMEGGVTSGVIYPGVVARLAADYDLASIGGTSAGAIAAAAAAAAQRGRGSGEVTNAFDHLADIPNRMAGPPDEGKRGERARRPGTRLEALFRPERSTRRLFRTLVDAAAEPAPPWRRVRWGLGSAARTFPAWILGGVVALSALLAALAGLLGLFLATFGGDAVDGRLVAVCALAALGLIVIVLGGLAGLATGVGVAISRLPGNFYGLCTGNRGKGSLTPWLARTIDDLSGIRGRPLTFGDLWGTDETGAVRHAADTSDPTSVDLQLMTTCLTLRRPYRLPFDRGARFFFCPKEMRRLFPKSVVKWMEGHSGTAVDGKLPLPEPRDLPVIVAVRLSLSYPVLLSAVPLWTFADPRLREEAAPDGEPPGELRRVWFTDGGVTSNFPLRLFDTLLPGRPTFAVNLHNTTGTPTVRDWDDPALWKGDGQVGDRPDTPGLFGFFAQLADTARGWTDGLQMTLPGYRERIVHVEQRRTDGEGGQNLRMSPDAIRGLADRGDRAGAMMVRWWEHPEADGSRWNRHRMVRYRLGVDAVARTFATVPRAFLSTAVPGPRYDRLVFATLAEEDRKDALARGNRQQDAARSLWYVSCDWGASGHAFTDTEPPRPHAELRMAPRL